MLGKLHLAQILWARLHLLLDMYNYFSELNGQTIQKACF